MNSPGRDGCVTEP